MSAWPWEDFEDFSLAVLGRYYETQGTAVAATPRTGDGGRDGEAAYVLGAGPLALSYRLWIEIKKRTTSNIDVHDIGGHVVLAFVRDVNKLIFVTNTRFTEGLRYAIDEFAWRSRMDYALITGSELLELAQDPVALDRVPVTERAPRAGETAPTGPAVLEARTSLDTRVDRVWDLLEEHDLVVPSGTPVFLTADFAVLRCARPLRLEISLESLVPGLQVGSGAQGPGGPVGVGDRFRTVHPLYVASPGDYTTAHCRFVARVADGGGATILVEPRGRGELRVIAPLLTPTALPSRREAEEEAGRIVQRFLAGSPFESLGVIAPAGTGKTYLVQALRRRWIGESVREVLLDAGLESTDRELALSVLRSLVPVRPEVFGLETDAVEAMLSRLGLSPQLAQRGAALLDGRAEGDAHSSVRALGELLAVLLALESRSRPTVVILEDLHKGYSSGLALLQEVIRQLGGLHKGRVLVVFTSRDVPDVADRELAAIWESHIRELTGERTTVVKLARPTLGEAVELLCASVPTLERHQALAIIEQVGLTPFALREALALLRDRGDVEYDHELGQHVLLRPERLQEPIDGHVFREPTRHRLELLRHRLPALARDFLDSAACLGKFFDVDAAAAACGATLDDAYAAIAEYQRLEILTARGLRAGQAAFDHDLIRRVVLEQMTAMRQRTLAGRLYQALAAGAGLAIRAALAYQAGLAMECFAHARALAQEMGRRGRPADAASALALAIAVVDDNLAQKVVNLSPRTRGSVDDAVAVAAPCTIDVWSDPERQDRLLELLMEYISYLSSVAGEGSRLLEEALSEAEMLATLRGNLFARASLVAHRGRQEFNVDCYERSVLHHREADEMLRRLGEEPAVRAARADNLHRLATGLRQLGQREEARGVLRDALRLRAGPDWGLLLKALSSWGATYFQSDWERVRHFWERAEEVARRRGRTDRLVHTLVDVGHLDLLEDRLDDAEARLMRAEALAQDHGYENSLLRVHLNLGCLYLVRGEYAAARHHLLAAEQLGVSNQLPRRLWRARANLATLYEAMEEPDRSYASERAMLKVFKPAPGAPQLSPRELESSLGNTRRILAVANLLLRARTSALHARLAATLGEVALRFGTEVAGGVRDGTVAPLPGLRHRHCKQIGSRLRFIVTE